ncbi:MAG: leucine-rich repeat protein [Rikenellaceae bacterium]
MRKIYYLFLILSFIAFVSCEAVEGLDDLTDDSNVENSTGSEDEEGEAGEDENSQSGSQDETPNVVYSIAGAIQKGPFIQGSSITISELDEDLNPTGVNYQTTTTDDTGSFEIGSQINSRFVEIAAKGYYFNEVSGAISSSELTLYAVSDLESEGVVNVNLLTSLANAKLKSLIKAGGEDYTFEQALAEAEKYVLSAFGLESSELHFDKMDITKSGDANAMLLAVSITVQGDRSVGEMSELVAKIGAEIDSSNVLESQTLKDAIQQGAVGVDLEQVRANLTKRYSDLGASCNIPAFENFIDSDGNGVIDSQEAWLLVKGEKSYPIDYAEQNVEVEIEQNINFMVDILYSDDEGWLSFYVAPTTRADIMFETIIFTATEHTGYNTRSATITLSNPDNEEQKSSITIDQSPKGALVLGKDSYNVKASGDVVEISFSTNVTDYSVEVEEDAKEWIYVTPTTKAVTMEEYKMNFTIAENTLTEARSGRIVITAGDQVDYITINQSGQQLLYIEEEDIEQGWTGGNVTFTVVHNGDYVIDWQDSNSCWNEWSYSVVSTSDSRDVYNINMTSQSFLLPSTYGVYSSNTIKVTSTDDYTLTDEIFVEQWPYPRVLIESGDTEQTLTSAKQDITIAIYSNNRTIIDVDGDWIHLSSSQPKYSSSEYTEYTYSIDANSGTSRKGTITFSAPYTSGSGKVVDEVITITQTGEVQETLTVNCPAAGTLSNYVTELQISSTTELILTGTVNADDCYNVINPMSQLEILDLSGARFENDQMTMSILDYNRESSSLRILKLPLNYDTTLASGSLYISGKTFTHIDFGGTTTLPASMCFQFDKLESVVITNVKGTIGTDTFGSTALKSIEIPEGVTELGHGAFSECAELESVKLPTTLITMGPSSSSSYYGVFSDCPMLKSIEIPASVETISGRVFTNCSSLESVTFAEGSKLSELYTTAGSYDGISGKVSTYSMFKGCTSLKTITIPASVETIQGPVFADSSLEEIIFESGSKLTTLVGGYVYATSGSGLNSWTAATVGCFQYAPIKSSMTLPESLTSLGNYAFANSTIDEITLPSVREMGKNTFIGTTAHTISMPSVYVIGTYAFAGTPNLKTLNIPKAYELGDYALYGSGYVTNNGGCFASEDIVTIGSYALVETGVTSLNLPNLEEAKESAFVGTPLATVSLPSLKIIGSNAFKDCLSLTSVSLPSLTVVGSSNSYGGYNTGNNVFSGCVNLDFASIVFENIDYVINIFSGSPITAVTESMFPNATTINTYAFSDCANLTSVDLPKIETLSSEAFTNCTSLESIGFEKVTEIPSNAFSECTKLKSIDFPNLTSIGNGSFFYCTSLETFDFKGVNHIGSDAFNECTALSTITNVEDVTVLYGGTFGHCTSLKSMPDWSGITTITSRSQNPFDNSAIEEFSASNITKFSNSFDNCQSLKRVYLPKATSIYFYSFENCNTLETIEIGTAATSLIEYVGIENNIPYSRAVTVKMGEYDSTKVTVDGNTLSNITFKEVIVVDNIQ